MDMILASLAFTVIFNFVAYKLFVRFIGKRWPQWTPSPVAWAAGAAFYWLFFILPRFV